MTLFLLLAAPGSPSRLLRPSARLAAHWQWHPAPPPAPSPAPAPAPAPAPTPAPAPALAPATKTARHIHLHQRQRQRQRHAACLATPGCLLPAQWQGCQQPVILRLRSAPIAPHGHTASFSTAQSTQPKDDEELEDSAMEQGDAFDPPDRERGARSHQDAQLAADEALDPPDQGQEAQSHQDAQSAADDAFIFASTYAPFKLQSKVTYRPSLSDAILESIQSTARLLYSSTTPGIVDLSHAYSRRITPSASGQSTQESLPAPPLSENAATRISMSTLLSRYVRHLSDVALQDEPFVCTTEERKYIERKGVAQELVQSWATSILQENSHTAARVFERGAENPPFFLVLVFLRRETIKRYTLGVVLNHLASRLEQEPISWQFLDRLATRLSRHARRVWPESTSWICTLILDKASKLYASNGDNSALAPRDHSKMTRFCNRLLLSLALPASLRPMIGSRHQENAQFRVLQFMAGYSPAIVVTRSGFRAIARIQLTHTKTEQEKDWAELKGPLWPPWKESRTAMDEDKGYEYGASRASKILHRMFEAGYPARSWEEVAEVYAGWDTDLSPTIQTRALLPYVFRGSHTQRLWEARIRTTRTRREAWACFLACEASGVPAHEQIYLALFEKLYYMEVQRRSDGLSHQKLFLHEIPTLPTSTLLPGDMKEVVADSSSPLHNVYLSEPVPTYEELFYRMKSKQIRPTTRLLSFLLETHPDFATTLELVKQAKDDFDGGVGCLLTGNHGETSTVRKVPDYLMTAFIRFLCRFAQSTKGFVILRFAGFPAQDEHLRQIMFSREYLLQYAYALLLHYRPRQQPTWLPFMERIIFSKIGHVSLYDEKDSQMGITYRQYHIVVSLIDTLWSVDVDIDGDLFILACTATRYAAQAMHRGAFTMEQERKFSTKRSFRLRSLFNQLVGSSADPQASASAAVIPSHMPGPAELHAYVRVLGVLRDYEGLYSFSTWITKHHKEVIARARAQHGGSDMLFRTLVALRAATGGWLEEGRDSRPTAPAEIKELIKLQIDSVEEWGGWPSKKYVAMYVEGHVRSATPVVGGR